MKNLFRVWVWLLCAGTLALAQGPYRTVTIRQIQEVSKDSLLRADGLQNSQVSRWTLQTSPFFKTPRETVEVVAQCIVPYKIINFTATGWTMLLRDTAQSDGSWTSMIVRVASNADTISMANAGFGNVERGDIIRIRGYVDEFPSTSMNSLTQFVPIPGIQISILGTKPIPLPPKMQAADFYVGQFPGGEIRYSTGEPFESSIVELTNLTVVSVLNSGRGTVNLVDADGNMISTYDASGWFTVVTNRILSDSTFTYAIPSIGARIDTIRGMITTVSGSENTRGYRIAPVYPGDMKVGITLPGITTHRREPVLVTSTDTAKISVKGFKPSGGLDLRSLHLRYRVDNGPWVVDSIQGSKPDSTYQWSITPKSANVLVRYYVQAFDVQGNSSTLASSATGGAGSDTSKGFFFYKAQNIPLTIFDLQWTPFTNGRAPYIGASATVSGIVTADTANMGISPLNTAGTNAWYMQASNQPWNGLWIVGPESTMAALRVGDSITVTGAVQEQFEVTRLANIAHPVTKHASGKVPPPAVVLTTGNFGPNVGNGAPQAEQYESMLVRFNNVTVSNINPVFSDNTEFELDDGSGGILVRREGGHKYSNVIGDTSLGKTIINQGDRFSFVQGIIYYSFNRYKLVPRGNPDFGTLTTGITRDDVVIPNAFTLEQNYPNPFNPSTIIRYDLPTAQLVTLKVYNLLGQEVRTLVNDFQIPGRYTVTMDGAGLSTGVYLYRLSTEGYSQVKRMILLK